MRCPPAGDRASDAGPVNGGGNESADDVKHVTPIDQFAIAESRDAVCLRSRPVVNMC